MAVKMNRAFELPLGLTLLRRLNFPKKLGVLERLYGSSLDGKHQHWITCANGVTWKLNLDDPCHRWMVYGKYEGGHGIELAAKALKNGGVYVDSGANIGQWLMYLAHLPEVQTYAFEPVSSERTWLQECLSQQNDWQVNVLDYGLGNCETELPIQVHGARSTVNLDWYEAHQNEHETIRTQRLDKVMSEHNVETIEFWKLDVEGFETQALEGASNLLEKQKVAHIYFECHPNNYTQNRQLLTDCGYQLYDLIKGRLIEKQDIAISTTADIVAIPA